MCGRYANILPPELVARVFGTAGPLPNYEMTWNMAPTKDAPIVVRDQEFGERQVVVAKWGLVPFFTKDLSKARKPINARRETVAGSPLFVDGPDPAAAGWRHRKSPVLAGRGDSSCLDPELPTVWPTTVGRSSENITFP